MLTCAVRVLQSHVDRQASLNEDEREVFEIEKAQKRAIEERRKAEKAGRRRREEEEEDAAPAAPVATVPTPKPALNPLMARWLARGSAHTDGP